MEYGLSLEIVSAVILPAALCIAIHYVQLETIPSKYA